MKGQEYINYLNGFNIRKQHSIEKAEQVYNDSCRILWNEFINSFPIKAGDRIKVGIKTFKVQRIEFNQHSCVETPLPVIYTNDLMFSIKDITYHNGEPFNYQDWVVEKK